MTDPLYPSVDVDLSEHDGNAFMIVSRVAGALRRAGVSAADVAQFNLDAMSGDYDNLLQTCMRWVHVS